MTAPALPAGGNPHGNLFAGPPGAGDEECFETLFANPAVRIERIVSHGHPSPAGFWYDQDDDEWVILMAGRAELAFADGRTLALQAGDWVSLPAHRRHRVEFVSADAVWLAVHCCGGDA